MTDWSAVSNTRVFIPTLILVTVSPHWISACWCSTGIETVLRLRTPSSGLWQTPTQSHHSSSPHGQGLFASTKTNQWHWIFGLIVDAELNKTNTNRIMVSAACINTVLSCLLLDGLFCFLKQRDLWPKDISMPFSFLLHLYSLELPKQSWQKLLC